MRLEDTIDKIDKFLNREIVVKDKSLFLEKELTRGGTYEDCAICINADFRGDMTGITFKRCYLSFERQDQHQNFIYLELKNCTFIRCYFPCYMLDTLWGMCRFEKCRFQNLCVNDNTNVAYINCFAYKINSYDLWKGDNIFFSRERLKPWGKNDRN